MGKIRCSEKYMNVDVKGCSGDLAIVGFCCGKRISQETICIWAIAQSGKGKKVFFLNKKIVIKNFCGQKKKVQEHFLESPSVHYFCTFIIFPEHTYFLSLILKEAPLQKVTFL